MLRLRLRHFRELTGPIFDPKFVRFVAIAIDKQGQVLFHCGFPRFVHDFLHDRILWGRSEREFPGETHRFVEVALRFQVFLVRGEGRRPRLEVHPTIPSRSQTGVWELREGLLQHHWEDSMDLSKVVKLVWMVRVPSPRISRLQNSKLALEFRF